MQITLEQTSFPTTPAVSLGDAKEFFREDRNIEDSLITSLVATAEKTISNYTGVHFIDTDFTLHLGGFKSFKIPKNPYQKGSIAIKYTDLTGTEQTLDSSKYEVYSQENPVKIEFNSDLPKLDDNKYPVRAEFTIGHGTTANSVPKDLKTAIKLLALIYWRRDIPEQERENLNPLRIKTLSTLIEDKKVSHFK